CPKRKEIHANETYTKGKTIKGLSEGEKERLRKGGQCFFCKEKAHTINYCKKRPQHHQKPMKPHQTPATNYTRITADNPLKTSEYRFPTSAHTRNDSDSETLPNTEIGTLHEHHASGLLPEEEID